jgi:hypothetical protein
MGVGSLWPIAKGNGYNEHDLVSRNRKMEFGKGASVTLLPYFQVASSRNFTTLNQPSF